MINPRFQYVRLGLFKGLQMYSKDTNSTIILPPGDVAFLFIDDIPFLFTDGEAFIFTS